MSRFRESRMDRQCEVCDVGGKYLEREGDGAGLHLQDHKEGDAEACLSDSTGP